MPRGRKAVPDEIKRLRGLDKKNPDRFNYAAPKPKRKKHRKPGWVQDKHAVEAWKYYGELLDKLGVLTTTDKMALEQLAIAYANWRRYQTASEAEGLIIDGRRNHNDIAARDWFDRTLKLLLEFGLTPASRGRITVDKPSDAVLQIQPRER